ncbi:MAG: hypothetical protein COA67_02345 [Lutibacter sp.]|nr:MAG: hypothetical protein COA67_02345 [Lutibacter sp.]
MSSKSRETIVKTFSKSRIITIFTHFKNMNRQIIYIVLVLFLTISCKSDNNKLETTSDSIDSLAQQDVNVSSIGITLSPKAKKEIETWLEYQMIQSKIDGYNKTTKSQALLNAMELAELVANASDTIDIKKLDRPDIKIRFNVLRNHALRLDDMSTITSISEQEVMTEVTSVLDAFSALNEKINIIYKIEEYEQELDVVSEPIETIDVKPSSSKNEIKTIKTLQNENNKKSRELIPLKKGAIKKKKPLK